MSSRTMLSILAVGIQTGLGLAVAGCSSALPPPELVEARKAYDHAQSGQAQALVPADVLAAKQALDQAETAFRDSPDAPRTRDLAYIAVRKAEIAEARGDVAAAQRDASFAQADIAQLRTWDSQRTKAELNEARAEVAGARQTMDAQQHALTAAERARREAEKRAALAIASLEKIAVVKEETRGMVITLNGSVLFETGKSTLLPIARDRLAQVAEALNENPEGAIVVEGYTDSTGALAMNEELSRSRADAVRVYLIEKGVDAARIRSQGFGPARPVADNKTPEGRANNRRVEIVIERKH